MDMFLGVPICFEPLYIFCAPSDPCWWTNHVACGRKTLRKSSFAFAGKPTKQRERQRFLDAEALSSWLFDCEGCYNYVFVDHATWSWIASSCATLVCEVSYFLHPSIAVLDLQVVSEIIVFWPWPWHAMTPLRVEEIATSFHACRLLQQQGEPHEQSSRKRGRSPSETATRPASWFLQCWNCTATSLMPLTIAPAK